jgi:dTDP-4-dehydrorhamnose reductase
MRVLMSGAAGQVGRALIASAPAHVELSALGHHELDVTDASALEDVIGRFAPDVIINAAAYTAVDRAETERELAHRVNAQGPRLIALAARAQPARLIHLSTDFVFDGTRSRPYRPEDPTHALSIYGASKAAGEQAVREVLPQASVVLRTAWVYAAEGRNFVRTMLRILGAQGSARVVSDQVGTPTAAGSVAQAIWGLIQHRELSGIHHWTDAGVASWYDFAVAIAEEAITLGLLKPGVTVVPITTEEYPTAARRPAFSVLDSRSLCALGIARVHWRERLRSVLEEIRNG